MSTHQQAQGATPESRFTRPPPPGVVAQARAAESLQNEIIEAAKAPLTPVGNEPAAQEPAPEPAPQAAPESAPQKQAEQPAARELTAEQWKQRYDAMHGRVISFERRMEAVTEENRSLRARIDALQAAPRTAPRELYITEEERRDYGDDLLNVVGKKAREETAELEQKIRDLENKFSTVQHKVELTDQQKMYSYLDNTVSKWHDTNRSPEFIEWLQYADVFSGQRRMDMLKEAHAQNNGPRVAAFFESFYQEAAAVAPKPKASEQTATKSPAVSLDKLAAPGRAMSAAPERPADEPEFISRAQIASFYADKAAGKFRGKEQDANSFERRIATASREGRIIP